MGLTGHIPITDKLAPLFSPFQKFVRTGVKILQLFCFRINSMETVFFQISVPFFAHRPSSVLPFWKKFVLGAAFFVKGTIFHFKYPALPAIYATLMPLL